MSNATAIILAVALVIGVFAWQCTERRACEQVGGKYYSRVLICLKKEAVLEP